MKKTYIIKIFIPSIFICSLLLGQEKTGMPLYMKNYREIESFGLLWGSAHERWKLPEISESAKTYNMNDFMVKNINFNGNLIISFNEIQEWVLRNNSEIIFEGVPFRKPSHWSFPKINPTLIFKDSLPVLLIQENNVHLYWIKKLKGIKYFTFYPPNWSTYDNKKDGDLVPVEYEILDLASINPKAVSIIFIDRKLLQTLNDSRIRVETTIESIAESPNIGTSKTMEVDLNADEQVDIVSFFDHFIDNITPDGDQGDDYLAGSSIVLYHGKWYRTAYFENGQDGMEGF